MVRKLNNFFLGHTIGLTDKGNDYDTVEERYQKLKHCVAQFTAFQFGICTFHWDDIMKKYVARPFNFYVFPRSKITDQCMLFQVSIYLKFCRV